LAWELYGGFRKLRLLVDMLDFSLIPKLTHTNHNDSTIKINKMENKR